MSDNHQAIPRSGDDRFSSYAKLKRLFPEASHDRLLLLLGLSIEKIAEQHSDAGVDQAQEASTLGSIVPHEESSIRNTNEKSELPGLRSQYPYSEKTVPFNYLSRIEFLDNNEESDKRSVTNDTVELVDYVPTRELKDIQISALCKWELLWPQLKSRIAETRQSKRIDVTRLTQLLVAQKPLKVIPRKNRKVWPTDMIIIIDESPHLTTFRNDYLEFVKPFLEWFGDRVRVVQCLDASLKEFYENGDILYDFDGLSRQTQVLYLGDLGLLSDSRLHSAAWVSVAKQLHEFTPNLYAFVFTDHVDTNTTLHHYWHIESWSDVGFALSKSLAVADIRESSEVRNQLKRLLAFLSFGFEVTPAIVRSARKLLGFSTALESLVLEEPVWIGQHLIFQWREASAQRSWQVLGTGFGYKEQAIKFFESFEKRLPLQLQIEQRHRLESPLNWEQTEFVQKLTLSLEKGKLEAEKTDIREWLSRVIERSDAEKWDEQLERLYFSLSSENTALPIPKGIRLENRPPLGSKRLKLNRYQVVQKANVVAVYPAERDLVMQKNVDSALASSLNQSGIPIATIDLDQQSYASIECDLKGDNARFWTDEKFNNALAMHLQQISTDVRSLEFISYDKRYTISQITCPPWADELAHDRIGLYADFSYKNVVQRFRWIPPGEFMMGSPESERGRWDDEGPVHLVQIESGYWMAETACTQSFWTAVMGNNPSEFSSDTENPVDKVSWLDCQQFLKRLNEIHAGLRAHLPTEAQWEYACRAGTQTPFSFGEELALENANYDGVWDWEEKDSENETKEKSSKSIRRTVNVKSYKRNRWGLYQMHGNVWEWCEDDWHGNYKGAPKDGSAWLNDDPDTNGDEQPKVVRGGAWNSYGRYVRSAYRVHDVAAVARSASLGFRVSLGPAQVTGLPKTGSRGKR